MKNGCPLFTALFIDGSGGNVTIVVCRAVGDGWLADRLPVWMGHKGCGSGQRSGARPTTLMPHPYEWPATQPPAPTPRYTEIVHAKEHRTKGILFVRCSCVNQYSNYISPLPRRRSSHWAMRASVSTPASWHMVPMVVFMSVGIAIFLFWNTGSSWG